MSFNFFKRNFDFSLVTSEISYTILFFPLSVLLTVLMVLGPALDSIFVKKMIPQIQSLMHFSLEE